MFKKTMIFVSGLNMFDLKDQKSKVLKNKWIFGISIFIELFSALHHQEVLVQVSTIQINQEHPEPVT